MKIDPNILSIMREMLADPEKDWSDHLPFIQITEEDFEKGFDLIRKYTKSADSREDAIDRFQRFKKKYKEGDPFATGISPLTHYDIIPFIEELESICIKHKSWERKTQIRKEIWECFEYDKFIDSEVVLEPFYRLFYRLFESRRMFRLFQESKKEVEETFNWEVATKVLKEVN